ncbi:hypothetical protein HPB52_011607 [Rhipicephalus sanguineus]|uniref:BPTI/Kunitz inhibitor domain-containing protein n=1 Tax=Rhipicephalus sanguineus TaxID=34632 RepID=A0A9D4PZF6_RHISA|nr:hypothetical protein HPB52_011607 [Rhipicephalus sanguineus]
MLGEGRDRSASAVPSSCESGSNAFDSDWESDSSSTTSQLSNRDDSEIESAQSDSSDDVECEPRIDGGLNADSPSPNSSLDSPISSEDEDDVECEARVDNNSQADELAVRFFTEQASTEQLLWTSSETLLEEDDTRSERNRSLPYVLIALVSGLLMVTAGTVLLNAKPTPDFSRQPNATYAGRRSPVHSVVASGRIAPALQAPREPTKAVGGASKNRGPPTFKRRMTESSSDSEERHLCDAVFYSYCPKPRSEFVFDPVMRTCIQTRDHEVELCNQSPNRFYTRADCYSSCVKTERPPGKCFDRPAFAKCQR